MWPWGPKNAGNFCRTSQKARCPIWSSPTRRNSTSSKLLTRKTIEFGRPHLRLKEELSPDAKICSLWWCGQQWPQPGDPRSFLFQREWNWTLSGTSQTFWKLSAPLGRATLQRRTVDPPTGFGALPWFKIYPIVDSEENPLIHKSGRLASAKPGSKPIGLLHLVHLGEKSVLYSSSNLKSPWRPNWWKGGTLYLKKRYVPRATRFQTDWRP